MRISDWSSDVCSSDLLAHWLIRASQINQCANCINMHAAEARAQGESEKRIYLLSAWRKSPCCTVRECAALQWSEALTRLSERYSQESANEASEAEYAEGDEVQLSQI